MGIFCRDQRERRTIVLRVILAAQMLYNFLCIKALGGLYESPLTFIHWIGLIIPAFLMTYEA